MPPPGSDGDGFADPEPSVRAADAASPAAPTLADGDAAPASRASDAFQRLASEVRVAVLRELLAAERAGATPVAFSELHAATPADTSAGFAYHLRQLDGHFVRATEGGYELTAAGRAAARLVDEGTLTGGPGQAS